MSRNPRLNISIQSEPGQEKWVEIMKQNFKERLIKGKYDYFTVTEDDESSMTVVFSPSSYTSQKEFLESFEKNVMEPARKAAGLK
ncbi:hypothetical protein AB4Z03_26815 [Bacillus sp. YAF12_1]|uniref:hypothetical protein n=1 Tax=Bacillus sp. YAF12_1 TaxID=3237484 RepID=UPI003F92B4C5